jgi:hypothetical protein
VLYRSQNILELFLLHQLSFLCIFHCHNLVFFLRCKIYLNRITLMSTLDDGVFIIEERWYPARPKK